MTCYTIRHGKGKVAPPRFARSFLIFFFISQKVAAYAFNRVPGSSLSSIQFTYEVGIITKAAEDRRKCLILFDVILTLHLR